LGIDTFRNLSVSVNNLLLVYHARVSVSFAVYTAAVLLTIESHSLGFGYAFFPASPKILIIELNAIFRSRFFSYFCNEIVLLILAVQKRSGKRGRSVLFRGCARGLKPHSVTLFAPEMPLARNPEKKMIKVI
jgi:hypothetical protein